MTLAVTTVVWSDFNALDGEGRITVALRHASGAVVVGATVVLRDGEGNSVEGRVTGVGTHVATVEVDMTTWGTGASP